MKTIDYAIYLTIFGGVAVSLVDIQTYMGIIILCIQAILLCVKLGFKIAEWVKKSKNNESPSTEEVIGAIDEATSGLQMISDKANEINDKKGGEKK